MKIIKRSGVEVFFDSNKIVAAVQKANASVIDYEKLSDEQIQEIADNVEVACENMKRSASVEEIQDHLKIETVCHGDKMLIQHTDLMQYPAYNHHQKNRKCDIDAKDKITHYFCTLSYL